LNATNPEVKEAFELMMRGGTPDQNDFSYTVPNYNTELQVLYWLACQNQFKKDDTLALAIAVENGIWVTIGDNEVIVATMKDTSDLLAFFRETNELQKQRGYYPLENYPLEAKIVLGWTGGESPDVAKSHALSLFLNKRLDLKSYHWDFTAVDTYRKMRAFMTNETVLVGGISLPTQYGSLLDESAFGIASTHLWLTSSHKPPGQSFNDFNLVYVPKDGVWKATPESFQNVAWVGTSHVWGALNESHLILFKPPVDQEQYLTGIVKGRGKFSYYCPETNFCDMLYPEYSKAYTSILGSSYEKGIAFDEMKKDVTDGIPSYQMKQWLLYSAATLRVF
jgi:hypothetical protein